MLKNLTLFYCFVFGEFCSRGLGAVRDLKKGELILKVPKSALLTSEIAMQDKKLHLAVNRHSCLSSVQVFVLNSTFVR
jgi:hypothetical protein